MSSTLIERVRSLHADVEETQKKILDLLLIQPKNAKESVEVDHALHLSVQDMLRTEKQLLDIYEDKDGARAAELQSMSGNSMWTSFYDALSNMRMYHAKFPAARHLNNLSHSAEGDKAHKDDEKLKEQQLLQSILSLHADQAPTFTNEEAYGKFVDLHDLFQRYINLPHFAHKKNKDYVSFLSEFSTAFQTIPLEKKLKASPAEYKKFLQDLRDYLVRFLQKTKPLVDTNKLVSMIEEDFSEHWSNKDVPGWFNLVTSNSSTTSSASTTTPSSTLPSSNATDSSTTSDHNNPLFCKACNHLFPKQTVYDSHLTGRKHKKNQQILDALTSSSASASSTSTTASATTTESGNDEIAKREKAMKALALLEEEVLQFSRLLQETIEATIAHIIKKQTRTYEELAAEQAAAEAAASSSTETQDDEEDENAPIYNPLNIPLGWDGKPIPYWLYMLHGLNKEFKCEICGNFSYWGPRNFEQHFTQWRHAYGMRCLGIPNTSHFHHITQISDAVQLYEKLKRENQLAGFKAEDDEECEDAEGNVFKKSVYIELKKQGLIRD